MIDYFKGIGYKVFFRYKFFEENYKEIWLGWRDIIQGNIMEFNNESVFYIEYIKIY